MVSGGKGYSKSLESSKMRWFRSDLFGGPKIAYTFRPYRSIVPFFVIIPANEHDWMMPISVTSIWAFCRSDQSTVFLSSTASQLWEVPATHWRDLIHERVSEWFAQSGKTGLLWIAWGYFSLFWDKFALPMIIRQYVLKWSISVCI